MPEIAPIIIIRKKKGGHGGHHGGAWKVAYADFVTAMMALFIVLWLLSASQEVQKAVGGYFLDPKGNGKQLGSSMAGNGESLTLPKNQMSHLKEKLEQAVRQMPDFDKKLKDHVVMTIAGEGLRIELLETAKGMFFDSGKPQPTEFGKDLLVNLAHELGKLKNSILIEGHTDSQAYDSKTYSNWELSADRANAARRIMQDNGLRSDQVTQVRGYADQKLRLVAEPENPSNRRVTVIVQYATTPSAPEPASGSGEKVPAKQQAASGDKKATAVPPQKAKA